MPAMLLLKYACSIQLRHAHAYASNLSLDQTWAQTLNHGKVTTRARKLIITPTLRSPSQQQEQ